MSEFMFIRPEVAKLLREAEKTAPKTLKEFRPRDWQGRFRKRTEKECAWFLAKEAPSKNAIQIPTGRALMTFEPGVYTRWAT